MGRQGDYIRALGKSLKMEEFQILKFDNRSRRWNFMPVEGLVYLSIFDLSHKVVEDFFDVVKKDR